jgi:DNA-binding PadR family transcriptional regulator
MNETGLREPAFLVLTSLAAEPQHGYAVIEDVLRISEGRVRLHTGSLYAILDRMRDAGLIEVDREEVVASRLRRYYRLTAAGATRLAEETQALRRHANEAAARLRRLKTAPKTRYQGGTA